MTGWHKASIAYTSTGFRRHNQPFAATSYGPEFVQGDVIGVGYRPRTGTVFFTRNGKKLDDVAHGLKTQNFFPTVGANGPCTVHVNFGQSGFVFIEANVKKWGLAPITGSLAPPPPYGSEQGSILLETGRDRHHANRGDYLGSGHARARSANFGAGPPASPGPIRSPTDISLAQLSHFSSNEDVGVGNSRGVERNVGGFRDSSHGDRVSEEASAIYSVPPPEYSSPDEYSHLNRNRSRSENSVDGDESDNSTRSSDTPVPSYDVAVSNR